jgi:beta-mannosidase
MISISSDVRAVRVPLDAQWEVTAETAPEGRPSLALPSLPATVPGNIHDDLMRAGVIPDPFYRLHERDVAWVDDTDWRYTGRFLLNELPGRDARLRFEGLDTVAEIALNGRPLGSSDNMFTSQAWPVSDYLCLGENRLEVLFRSARRMGSERQVAWSAEHDSPLPDPFLWSARSFVRKAQYMFGWDWGPVLISCGIWRPIYLDVVPLAEIGRWAYDVSFHGDEADVTLTVHVGRAPGGIGTPLEVLASVEGVSEVRAEVAPRADAAMLTLTIPDPRRWSPLDPHLYGLLIHLRHEGIEVDRVETRLGLRTVELMQEMDPDGRGQRFTFRVNGEDTFCKGANWIPADSVPSRAYDVEERLRPLLDAAKTAGFNMLRVWGGGFYESETFHNLCDELGLLVWQDFPFACAYYPDSEEYLEACRSEAVDAVRRIRNHPSLALWCGNNENQQMYADNWKGLSPPYFLGGALYDRVLPEVVAAENPHTPYWPGSAYGGPSPNSPDYGDRHNWDVWHANESDGDWPHYLQDRSRFCSEFGFASSCGLSAWDRVLAPEDRTAESTAVQWHCKTGKPYDVYLGYIERHFPPIESLDDLVYYGQLNQAEAMRCAVEHYRRSKGRCWGTLIWQLNDCWPVQSWSLIDSDGEEKAAYYASRRFYSSTLASLVLKDDLVEAHLVNDLNRPVDGTLRVSLNTLAGEPMKEWSLDVAVPANAAKHVASIEPQLGSEPRDLYLRADLVGSAGIRAQNLLFFAEPKDLRLLDPRLSFRVEPGAHGPSVVLAAQAFAAFVWLSAPGLGALNWSDNFFHLAPGETRSVTVGAGHVSAEALSARLQIRTLFDPRRPS